MLFGMLITKHNMGTKYGPGTKLSVAHLALADLLLLLQRLFVLLLVVVVVVVVAAVLLLLVVVGVV